MLSFVEPAIVSLPGRVCVQVKKQGSYSGGVNVNLTLSHVGDHHGTDGSTSKGSKLFVLVEHNDVHEECFSDIREGNYTATLESPRATINGTAVVEVTRNLHHLVSETLASVLEQVITNLTTLQSSYASLQLGYSDLRADYDQLHKEYLTSLNHSSDDVCTPNPCGLGTCERDNNNRFSCKCQEGFSAPHNCTICKSNLF